VKVPAQGLLRLLKGETAPVAFLLSGPEVARVLDGAELVRTHFRRRGVEERELVVADRGFDWEAWLAARASGSLFAEARLAEVRLLETGPNAGRIAPRLLASASAASPLLVTAFTLEKTFRASAFCRAWEKDVKAAYVEIWPLRLGEWPDYVARAARDLPRPLAPGARTLLARATEGNVQALRDALARIRLLAAPGADPLTADEVSALLDEEPRIGAFDFAEALLANDLGEALGRLAALERLGVEPLLVTGALAHRLRAEFLPAASRAPAGRRPPPLPPARAALLWRALVRLDQDLKGGDGLPPWRALEGLVRGWIAHDGRNV
jgi:DNA polymerase-3 subunit delta